MIIKLSGADLTLAFVLVMVVALLSMRMRLGLETSLVISAVRTFAQLLLIGFVLEFIFNLSHWSLIMLMGLAMLTIAAVEVRARQQRRLNGPWNFTLGFLAIFSTALPLSVATLVLIIQPVPWYEPQYFIPILGILLGNTMTAVSLAMDQLVRNTCQQRLIIEARLALGQHRDRALADIIRESARSAMIPIINAMAAAGIISLPGTMTGQILSGTSPLEAVKYQILIMFLLATTTGLSTLLILHMMKRRLFDQRHRLRLDRLAHKRSPHE